MPKPPAYAPWLPVPINDPKKPDPFGRGIELSDISAIQACIRGDASREQQQQAMACIINTIAGTYEPSFYPTESRGTDFAEGRRFVGLQLVRLLKINVSALAHPGRPTEQG